MKTLLYNKQSVWLLVFVTLLTAFLFFTYDVEYSASILVGLAGGILFLFLLFFNLRWYYLLAVGLIPYSTDLIVAGGAKFSFPSEGMLVVLLPVVFVFNKKYWFAFGKIIKHPITILLLADLSIQLLTSLTGTEVEVSLKRVFIRFIFIFGFFVLINMMTTKKQLIYPWLAYVIGLVPVMYKVLQMHAYHNFNPRVVFSISRPYYDDHTIYGASLAFVLPMLFLIVRKYKEFELKSSYRILLAVVLIVMSISELLALSRAAILSVGVALLFYLLLKLRVRFVSLVSLLAISLFGVFLSRNVLMNYIEQNEAVSNDGEIVNHFSSVTNLDSDASNLERINRWVCAIRMFEERPLLGFGPGTYQFEYNKFQTLSNKTYISSNSGDRGNAHSEYLTYLSENGILGFVIFLLTVFAAIYYGMQNHYQLDDQTLKIINLGVLLGVVTFFFHGLFNMFIDQSKIAFLYFTSLGTIVWINMRLKKCVE